MYSDRQVSANNIDPQVWGCAVVCVCVCVCVGGFVCVCVCVGEEGRGSSIKSHCYTLNIRTDSPRQTA